MDEIIKLLDKNLEYVSHSIKDNTIFINIKSCNNELICPICKQSSTRIHSTYTRTLQDLPIQDKKVILVLNNKKMFCDNINCSKVTFAETFSFYNFKAKKTKRLEEYIFINSLNVSTIVSANLLKKNVANVSKSTVGNILKKRKVIEVDKSTINAVCIDDFALKKRHRYGTIMIDISTHKIVDMIESRKKEDIIEWLKTFPNLRIVSRDGSLTYQDAIDIAHPNVIQISDKFHIFKNLTDYCCKYIKSLMKNNIEIPCNNEFSIVSLRKKYKFNTKWELIYAVKELSSRGCSIKNIQDILSLNFRTVKKYLEVNDKDKDKYDIKPKYVSVSETKLQRKLEIQKEVRNLIIKGNSYREIEKILGVDRRTAKKYAETDDLSDGRIGQRKYGKITPYLHIIKDLLSKQYSKRKIYELIKLEGYDGCESLLREYLIREMRNEKLYKKECFTEVIQRQKIISLLYKPIEKINGLN